MSAQAVQDALHEHILAETVCRVVTEASGRVACLTPLEYPDGDSVCVWASQRNGTFEVTDYGEAFVSVLSHRGADRKVILDTAGAICAQANVGFVDGRISVRSALPEIGEAIWRVASMSAQVAQVSAYYRTTRQRPTNEFADVVYGEISRRAHVQRGLQLPGKSGHVHKATFYLPASNSIVEPIGSEGHWNQVANAYARMGDLGAENGYGLVSIVDNRQEAPKLDVLNLLVQVSRVVEWTRREEWLANIT